MSQPIDTGPTPDPLGAQHWPEEIRLKQAEKELEILWEDGVAMTYPAELLRVESPSAEVQGHGADDKTIVPSRRHVGILEIEPVGNYAIRIKFDDLHDTGLFSWKYLRGLGANQDAVWQRYLAALEAQGLSRDP